MPASHRASRPQAPTGPARRDGVPAGRPLVAFVGTLEPRKGVASPRRRLRPAGRGEPDTMLVLWGRPAGGWPRPSTPWPGPATRTASCGSAICPTTRCPRCSARRRRRLSGARGGVRTARVGGAGLRRPADDDRRDGHGRSGRGAASSSLPATLLHWPMPSHARSRRAARRSGAGWGSGWRRSSYLVSEHGAAPHAFQWPWRLRSRVH